MKVEVFHQLLDRVCAQLTLEAKTIGFSKALVFENRVREVTQQIANELDTNPKAQIETGFPDEFPLSLVVDMNPPAQGFPDIVLGDVGIEVKYTEADTWRCIANSVLETNKVQSVKHISVVYCKMGGEPEVRYDDWEHAVMHVRTSHVPRFEIEIGTNRSLFKLMGISYNDFSALDMSEKMVYIRNYARSRLRFLYKRKKPSMRSTARPRRICGRLWRSRGTSTVCSATRTSGTRPRSGSAGAADNKHLWTLCPEVQRVWGAPQQAFLRAPGHAKIAGVGTPALLAETCIPATWHEKTEVHAFLTHPPFSGPFSVPPLWLP